MDYLLDTNILLAYIRNDSIAELLDKDYKPLSNDNTAILSVVTVGEIESLALQNKWGEKRKTYLKELLNQFLIADIKVESIIKKYAEIDAFSQGKHPTLVFSSTPRNMGKNDLWIAATASVLEAKLLTTDRDFEHLQQVFLEIECIRR